MSDRQPIFTRITIRVRERELAERIAAEAFAAGAAGLEEREEEGAIRLLVYAPASTAQRVSAALSLPGAEQLTIIPNYVEALPYGQQLMLQ